jgi:hypothetical protein
MFMNTMEEAHTEPNTITFLRNLNMSRIRKQVRESAVSYAGSVLIRILLIRIFSVFDQ